MLSVAKKRAETLDNEEHPDFDHQSPEWRRYLDEQRFLVIREDLAEWLSQQLAVHLTEDTVTEALKSGVLVCQLANHIEGTAESTPEEERPTHLKFCRMAQEQATRACGVGRLRLRFFANAQPETFLARDNAVKFLRWCRELGMPDVLLFESNDMVEGRNERAVLNCLLEVARLAATVGMEPSQLIAMEMDIEREEEEEEEEEGDETESATSAEEEDEDEDSEEDDEDAFMREGVQVDEVRDAQVSEDNGAPCSLTFAPLNVCLSVHSDNSSSGSSSSSSSSYESNNDDNLNSSSSSSNGTAASANAATDNRSEPKKVACSVPVLAVREMGDETTVTFDLGLPVHVTSCAVSAAAVPNAHSSRATSTVAQLLRAHGILTRARPPADPLAYNHSASSHATAASTAPIPPHPSHVEVACMELRGSLDPLHNTVTSASRGSTPNPHEQNEEQNRSMTAAPVVAPSSQSLPASFRLMRHHNIHLPLASSTASATGSLPPSMGVRHSARLFRFITLRLQRATLGAVDANAAQAGSDGDNGGGGPVQLELSLHAVAVGRLANLTATAANAEEGEGKGEAVAAEERPGTLVEQKAKKEQQQQREHEHEHKQHHNTCHDTELLMPDTPALLRAAASAGLQAPRGTLTLVRPNTPLTGAADPSLCIRFDRPATVVAVLLGHPQRRPGVPHAHSRDGASAHARSEDAQHQQQQQQQQQQHENEEAQQRDVACAGAPASQVFAVRCAYENMATHVVLPCHRRNSSQRSTRDWGSFSTGTSARWSADAQDHSDAPYAEALPPIAEVHEHGEKKEEAPKSGQGTWVEETVTHESGGQNSTVTHVGDVRASVGRERRDSMDAVSVDEANGRGDQDDDEEEESDESDAELDEDGVFFLHPSRHSTSCLLFAEEVLTMELTLDMIDWTGPSPPSLHATVLCRQSLHTPPSASVEGGGMEAADATVPVGNVDAPHGDSAGHSGRESEHTIAVATAAEGGAAARDKGAATRLSQLLSQLEDTRRDGALLLHELSSATMTTSDMETGLCQRQVRDADSLFDDVQARVQDTKLFLQQTQDVDETTALVNSLVSDTKVSTDALHSACEEAAGVMEDTLSENADIVDTARQWLKPVTSKYWESDLKACTTAVLSSDKTSKQELARLESSLRIALERVDAIKTCQRDVLSSVRKLDEESSTLEHSLTTMEEYVNKRQEDIVSALASILELCVDSGEGAEEGDGGFLPAAEQRGGGSGSGSDKNGGDNAHSDTEGDAGSSPQRRSLRRVVSVSELTGHQVTPLKRLKRRSSTHRNGDALSKGTVASRLQAHHARHAKLTAKRRRLGKFKLPCYPKLDLSKIRHRIDSSMPEGMREIMRRKRASLRPASGLVVDVRATGDEQQPSSQQQQQQQQQHGIKRPAFQAINMPVNVSKVSAKVNTGLSRRASSAIHRKSSSTIAAVDKFRKQRKKKRQANDKLLPLVEQTIAQAGLTNAVTFETTWRPGCYVFGSADKAVFVRQVRTHLMVRTGGGWDTLLNYVTKLHAAGIATASATSTPLRGTGNGTGGGAGPTRRRSGALRGLRTPSPSAATSLRSSSSSSSKERHHSGERQHARTKGSPVPSGAKGTDGREARRPSSLLRVQSTPAVAKKKSGRSVSAGSSGPASPSQAQAGALSGTSTPTSSKGSSKSGSTKKKKKKGSTAGTDADAAKTTTKKKRSRRSDSAPTAAETPQAPRGRRVTLTSPATTAAAPSPASSSPSAAVRRSSKQKASRSPLATAGVAVLDSKSSPMLATPTSTGGGEGRGRRPKRRSGSSPFLSSAQSTRSKTRDAA